MARAQDMSDTADSSLRELRLPAPLCAAAEKLLKETPFTTLEELVAFVLQELTARDAAGLDQEERAMIEQRLRDLGYL